MEVKMTKRLGGRSAPIIPRTVSNALHMRLTAKTAPTSRDSTKLAVWIVPFDVSCPILVYNVNVVVVVVPAIITNACICANAQHAREYRKTCINTCVRNILRPLRCRPPNLEEQVTVDAAVVI
jgi:hypothetical protein